MSNTAAPEDRPLLSRNDPEQRARFREAVKAQKAEKEKPGTDDGRAFYTPNEQHYKGYCPSLDITFAGRSHYKQELKRRGLHCVG